MIRPVPSLTLYASLPTFVQSDLINALFEILWYVVICFITTSFARILQVWHALELCAMLECKTLLLVDFHHNSGFINLIFISFENWNF